MGRFAENRRWGKGQPSYQSQAGGIGGAHERDGTGGAGRKYRARIKSK